MTRRPALCALLLTLAACNGAADEASDANLYLSQIERSYMSVTQLVGTVRDRSSAEKAVAEIKRIHAEFAKQRAKLQAIPPATLSGDVVERKKQAGEQMGKLFMAMVQMPAPQDVKDYFMKAIGDLSFRLDAK